MRKKLTIASVVSLVVLPVLMPTNDASAIPVFARKYGTSCYTCHSGFVTRNAFGEAFRNNGYRWPGGEDEDKAKQEQVKIGSDGWKKSFPDSPWPADIPAFAPFAVWVRGNIFNYSSTQTNAAGVTTRQQTLNWGNSGAIQNTALFFGGTIGENLSIFGEFDAIAGTPRGQFVWAFKPGLNLAFGNFFSDFSFGQAITTSNAVLPTDPNPNALGTGSELVYTQERYKITGGLRQAGITTTATGVNAATNANHLDDIRYLRGKYKFGGAGLLSGAGGTYGNEFVGLDNHIAIGASVVSMRDDMPVAGTGTTVLNNPSAYANESLIYECDITGNSGNFTGGISYSKCSDKGYNNFAIQTGYFLYPWLKATVNYTSIQDGLNPNLAFGITAWLRANASLALTYTRPTKDFVYTQATPNADPVQGLHSVNTLALTTGFAF